MVRLSANLGFLWTDLPLPDAIRAAADAGFDAVECHFPYDVDPAAITAAVAQTGLPMLGLNTAPGSTPTGSSGLAAVPGHEPETRRLIDQAVDYAATIGCAHVHVMAGRASGPAARVTYLSNLEHAVSRADDADVRVVIEPINQRDMPGYFLSEVEQAADVIAEITGTPSTDPPAPLGIMFDCYHVQITQGDLLRRFEAHLPLIGHVQFAGVPQRGEPDDSEVDYAWLLTRFVAAGYSGYAGAEYRPATTTEAGLGWMQGLR
jgi:hydroxypyruvate isomerase